MQHTTFLQATGNLIQLLIFIGIPLVLVIKNPQTTLSLIKVVFALLVSAGKFILPLIVSFIVWVEKTFTNNPKSYWPSSSNYGSSTDDVDTVRTYQNGVDGPERNPGTTFYH